MHCVLAKAIQSGGLEEDQVLSKVTCFCFALEQLCLCVNPILSNPFRVGNE